MPAKIKDRDAHFWGKVKSGGPDDCWEWQGGRYGNGYGQLEFDGVKLKAHRYAAYLYGIVDELQAPKDRKSGGFVLHQCDNKLCCNPRHLRAGTLKENAQDDVARRRCVSRVPRRDASW